jgi:hypothetical protein
VKEAALTFPSRVVVVNPSKASVLMDSLLPYIPAWVLKFGLRIPSKISNALNSHRRIMDEVATDIVNDKVGESDQSDVTTAFDIFGSSSYEIPWPLNT